MEPDRDFNTDEAEYEQPTSWEDFWQRSTSKHDEAMRQAGKDPNAPFEPSMGKHGQKIERGLPVDGCLNALDAQLMCTLGGGSVVSAWRYLENEQNKLQATTGSEPISARATATNADGKNTNCATDPLLQDPRKWILDSTTSKKTGGAKGR
eukprot:CAMPEP_0196587906 /NCGR_PEP_ID=MMETSP1081-20130531/58983_1 /TAXON_ID=36882 /ORGANISM="Pyramimonas amylifera, Strain CCMP720" /LENGTH=150 /DNA_ID=CAMNT_0041910237 /DNA_START=61 /DNA_END=511 /DNA_ORIENTATION=-